MKKCNWIFCWILAVGSLASVNAIASPLDVTQVAPGIFVHFGKHEDMTEANQGDIANIGFIIGSDAIAVIDTGGSLGVGKQLKATIEQTSSLPIKYVILTHVHPDHTLGASVFLDSEPQIIGHHKLPNSILQRGDFYIDRFSETLGSHQVDTLVLPNLLVEDELTIDLGDRELRLVAHKTSHTDNDLSVFDHNTKTLWLSDLLFVERTPIVDGSIVGWIETLKSVQDIEAELVVPGHGSIVKEWPQGAMVMMDYLQSLASWIRSMIQQGISISEALKQAEGQNSDEWLLFEDSHPRNVTKAYSELEWE